MKMPPEFGAAAPGADVGRQGGARLASPAQDSGEPQPGGHHIVGERGAAVDDPAGRLGGEGDVGRPGGHGAQGDADIGQEADGPAGRAVPDGRNQGGVVQRNAAAGAGPSRSTVPPPVWTGAAVMAMDWPARRVTLPEADSTAALTWMPVAAWMAWRKMLPVPSAEHRVVDRERSVDRLQDDRARPRRRRWSRPDCDASVRPAVVASELHHLNGHGHGARRRSPHRW